MNLDFFKKTRILDGGMGQELLARGLISKGTLWSASAILEKKFQNLEMMRLTTKKLEIKIATRVIQF